MYELYLQNCLQLRLLKTLFYLGLLTYLCCVQTDRTGSALVQFHVHLYGRPWEVIGCITCSVSIIEKKTV